MGWVAILALYIHPHGGEIVIHTGIYLNDMVVMFIDNLKQNETSSWTPDTELIYDEGSDTFSIKNC